MWKVEIIKENINIFSSLLGILLYIILILKYSFSSGFCFFFLFVCLKCPMYDAEGNIIFALVEWSLFMYDGLKILFFYLKKINIVLIVFLKSLWNFLKPINKAKSKIQMEWNKMLLVFYCSSSTQKNQFILLCPNFSIATYFYP